MKRKMGLVFTETGQAQVEFPEEKTAEHPSVSSRGGEVGGTNVGVGREQISHRTRENERGYIFLDER